MRHFNHALFHIQRYQDRVIIVNQKPYDYPIIVLADQLIAPWEVQSLAQLSSSDFDCLLSFSPDIVLLGTGQQSEFPCMHIFKTLMAHHIPFEVMSTKAACGSYTLLVSEGKKVAAALIN